MEPPRRVERLLPEYKTGVLPLYDRGGFAGTNLNILCLRVKGYRDAPAILAYIARGNVPGLY